MYVIIICSNKVIQGVVYTKKSYVRKPNEKLLEKNKVVDSNDICYK